MGPNNSEWNIYSASQNLAAVLNDPNKGKQSNFFIRTWGDHFIEKIDIPKSQFLTEINFGHFENYLRKHGRRYKKHSKLKNGDGTKNQENIYKKVDFSDKIDENSVFESERRLLRNYEKSANNSSTNPKSVNFSFDTFESERKLFQNNSSHIQKDVQSYRLSRKSDYADIKSIPEIFLRQNLPLNDQGTFNAIFPSFVSFENTNSQKVSGRESGRLIQEKLSHFLDIVEVEIAIQVAQKSSDFFYAMKSHDTIMEQMSLACVNVKNLRKVVKKMDSDLTKGTLRLFGLVKSRKNRLKTLEKLKMISTVLQTQPTLQLLLSNSDYVGALELIMHTQAVLSTELAGVTSLRHLPSQLKEMSRLIDKMLNAEFEKYIFADLNRPLDRTGIIEPDRLTSIIAGLLRQKNLIFLDFYKKEAVTSAQAILKQITIETVANNSEKDLRLTGCADSISVGSNLSSVQWLTLIEMSIEALSKLALRVKDTHDCIKDISDLYSGKFKKRFRNGVDCFAVSGTLGENVSKVGSASGENGSRVGSASGENGSRVGSASGENFSKVGNASGENVFKVGSATGENVSKVGGSLGENGSKVGSASGENFSKVGSASGENVSKVGGTLGENVFKVGSVTGENGSKVGNATGENVPKVGSSLGENGSKVGSATGENGSKFGSAPGENFSKFGSAPGINVPKVGTRLGENVSKVGSTPGENFSKVDSATGENVPKVGSAPGENVPKVGTRLEENVSKVGSTSGENVPKVGSTPGENVPKVGSATGENVPKVGSALGENFSKVGSVTGENVPKVGSTPGENVPKVGSATGENIPKVGNATGENVPKVGSALGENFSKVGSVTGENVPKVGNATGENFPKVGSTPGENVPKVGSTLGETVSKDETSSDALERAQNSKKSPNLDPNFPEKVPKVLTNAKTNSTATEISSNSNSLTEKKEKTIEKPSENVQNSEIYEEDDFSETFLTAEDVNRIEIKLKDLLTTISDYFHDRIAKMILDVSSNIQISKTEVSNLQNLIEKFSELLQRICGRKSSALTIAFNTQASKYVTGFHNSRKGKIILLLDTERWKVAEIPGNFQKLVEKLEQNDSQLCIDDLDSAETNVIDCLNVANQKFVTVGVVLMLLRLISEYCRLVCEIPTQSLSIGRNLSELLKTFNSRTCQLILGANALKTAGLKTITTTNLALASRSLQLIKAIIPFLRKYFTNYNEIPGLDLVERDISNHICELEAKILNIMTILLSEQLNDWTAKPPVPSSAFRNISKHLVKLHEAVNKILPSEQINEIYTIIHKNFKDRLRDQITKMNISNDGGPKHGAVTSELMFYAETLKKLNVIPIELQNMDDIWTKKV